MASNLSSNSANKLSIRLPEGYFIYLFMARIAWLESWGLKKLAVISLSEIFSTAVFCQCQIALGQVLFIFHSKSVIGHLSQCDCVVWHLPEIPETSKLPNVKLVLVQGRTIEDNIYKSKQWVVIFCTELSNLIWAISRLWNTRLVERACASWFTRKLFTRPRPNARGRVWKDSWDADWSQVGNPITCSCSCEVSFQWN